MLRKKTFLCCFLLLGVVFLGCEKNSAVKTSHVKGKITLGGVSLENATVSFHAADSSGNPPASGITDANGVFELSAVGGKAKAGAVSGKYIVTVTRPVGETKVVPGKLDSYGKPFEETTYTETVPSKYLSKSTSPLEAAVTDGQNEFNFDLTE